MENGCCAKDRQQMDQVRKVQIHTPCPLTQELVLDGECHFLRLCNQPSWMRLDDAQVYIRFLSHALRLALPYCQMHGSEAFTTKRACLLLILKVLYNKSRVLSL